MAAPTYRGHTTSMAVGTTSVSVAEPASCADGDLMILMVETSDSTTAAGTPNTPTDWDKIYEDTDGSGATNVTTLTIFARIRSGSATVTVDGVGDHVHGRMSAITTGTHDVTTPSTDIVVGAASKHGTGTSGLTTTGITVTADSLVLWVMGLSDDANDTTNAASQTNANLASITERFDNTSNNASGGGLSLTTATCAGTTTGNGTWAHDTGVQAQSVYLGIPPAPPGVLSVTSMLDEMSDTNADSYTTAGTVAFTAGRWYIACVNVAKNEFPVVPATVAGSTISFTLENAGGLAVNPTAGMDTNISVWYVLAGSTVTETLTVSATTPAWTGYTIHVFEVTGGHASDIIEGSIATDSSASANTLTPTLAAFTGTDDRPVVFTYTNSGETITFDTGFTQIGNQETGTAPVMKTGVAWHSTTQDTTPTSSWTTADGCGAIAFKLQAAGAAATTQVFTIVTAS